MRSAITPCHSNHVSFFPIRCKCAKHATHHGRMAMAAFLSLRVPSDRNRDDFDGCFDIEAATDCHRHVICYYLPISGEPDVRENDIKIEKLANSDGINLFNRISYARKHGIKTAFICLLLRQKLRVCAHISTKGAFTSSHTESNRMERRERKKRQKKKKNQR